MFEIVLMQKILKMARSNEISQITIKSIAYFKTFEKKSRP